MTMDIITKKKLNDLRRRAQAGAGRAQWELGYYHEYGAQDASGRVLLKPDRRVARRWYALAAEQGDAGGQLALSTLLSSGAAASREYEEAIRWAKLAIDQGDAAAAFNLGTIYRDRGKPALAFRWYLKAVEMGDKGASLDVGLCYLFGFGTKQDLDAACRCLGRLVNRTSALVAQRTTEHAHYWLAVLYLLGHGKPRGSVVRARALLERANEDQDHEQANELLNLIGKSKYLEVRPGSQPGRRSNRVLARGK